MKQSHDSPQTNGNREYDGQCAFAVSTGKLGVVASPNHTIETDGRTYAFKNGAARLLWRVLPGRAAKADQVWGDVAGST